MKTNARTEVVGGTGRCDRDPVVEVAGQPRVRDGDRRSGLIAGVVSTDAGSPKRTGFRFCRRRARLVGRAGRQQQGNTNATFTNEDISASLVTLSYPAGPPALSPSASSGVNHKSHRARRRKQLHGSSRATFRSHCVARPCARLNVFLGGPGARSGCGGRALDKRASTGEARPRPRVEPESRHMTPDKLVVRTAVLAAPGSSSFAPMSSPRAAWDRATSWP